MEWPPTTLKQLLWSPFKLIPLEFALTILIAERIEQCRVEKVLKKKRRNASCLKCGFLMFVIWTAWKKWLVDIYIIATLEHTSFLIRSRTVLGYVFIDSEYHRIYFTYYFFTFYGQRIMQFWFIYVCIYQFFIFFSLMDSE